MSIRLNKQSLNIFSLEKIILSFGFLLIIIYLFLSRSLWLDECYLAYNLTDSSFSSLFKPLHFRQVAPIGFLIVSKLSFWLFGDSALSLRLPSMLAGFASLLLANSIFKRVLNKNSHLIALLLFVTTPIFYRYTYELKQYIFDLAIFELVLFFYLKIESDYSHKNLMKLGFTGALAIWFSLVSVIGLTFIGLMIFLDLIRQKEKISSIKNSIIYCYSLWLISFATYYILFIYNHPHHKFMVSCWKYDESLYGFPFSYQINEIIKWLVTRQVHMISYFSLTNNKLTGIITVALLIVGFATLIFKEKKLAIKLIFFPICFHVTLALINVYPFSQRLCLYLLPVYIFLIVKGIERLKNKKTIFCLIILAVLSFWSINLIKQRISNSISRIESSYEDKLFSYLNRNVSEGENIVLLNIDAMIYQIYYHKKYPLEKRNVIFDYKLTDNYEVDYYYLLKNNLHGNVMYYSFDGKPNASVFRKLEREVTWFVFHSRKANLRDVKKYLLKFKYTTYKQVLLGKKIILKAKFTK